MCCAQVALLRHWGAFAAADPSADPEARRWWPLLLAVLAEAARDLLTSVPELCQLCIHGQRGATKVSGGEIWMSGGIPNRGHAALSQQGWPPQPQAMSSSCRKACHLVSPRLQEERQACIASMLPHAACVHVSVVLLLGCQPDDVDDMPGQQASTWVLCPVLWHAVLCCAVACLLCTSGSHQLAQAGVLGQPAAFNISLRYFVCLSVA